MKKRGRSNITPTGIAMAVSGVLLVCAVGWICLEFSLGSALVRLSYDLLFSFRRGDTREIRIIYMDENAARELKQRDGVWRRDIHARLVRRLQDLGAKAVFFDLVFFDPSSDPTADQQFAEAMKAHGNVFMGARLELDSDSGGTHERVMPPTPVLRKAAAGWGLLAFRPIDPDYGVRQLYTGTERVPTLTWRMAESLGATLPKDFDERSAQRWLRYYGPVGCFESVSYDRAMREDGVRPDFFRDRVVFVGARSMAGVLGMGREDFVHPYTMWTRRFSPGVEIHATAFNNLMRGEWLVRREERHETLFVLAFGAAIAMVFPHVRLPFAAAGAVACTGGLAWWSWDILFGRHLWFAWAIPALVQVPLAFGWATIMRYFLVERRRSLLHRAFEHYLSPDITREIAAMDIDLAPGGREVDATVMFTDLEGFTHYSETLAPSELSAVLTEYFTRATDHVLDLRGTIVKFIGDSVFAIWGAPLTAPDDAARAVRAAKLLHQASMAPFRINGSEFNLRTRIGLHSGRALAGNLGSHRRFDYTVIGDTVNVASRLESLNKHFGTSILISRATKDLMGQGFVARRIGDVVLYGRAHSIEVHELVDEADSVGSEEWIPRFEEGVDAYGRGDLPAADAAMREVMSMRGGADGPASVYLAEIEVLKRDGLPANWAGKLVLRGK